MDQELDLFQFDYVAELKYDFLRVLAVLGALPPVGLVVGVVECS